MTDMGLLKEELERLYRLWRTGAGVSARALYVLIVVGFAVFALMVVPF